MSREGLPAATRFLVIASELCSMRSRRSRRASPRLDFGSTRDARRLDRSCCSSGAALLLAGQLLTPPGALSALVGLDRGRARRTATLLDAARPGRRRGGHRLQHRSRAARRSSRLMRHTRTGWWLEEAGDVTPRPRSRATPGPTSSSSAAGTSASGRPGSSASSSPSWTCSCSRPASAGTGRADGTAASARRSGATRRRCARRSGDAAALAVCRASEDAVRGVGAWCDANDVDAWFREAPMLRVATTESQLGSWDETVRAAAALGAPEEVVSVSADDVRARCASPLFLGGELYRLNATVQPARLALGLRSRAPRARHPRARADGGHAARSGRQRRDTNGSRPRGVGRAGRQLGGCQIPRLPALARRRVEPHRSHRADPGCARRARLDGRRGDRRQPQTRALHADDPRRPDRVRLGRRRDGVRRDASPTGSSSTAASSPRRARASRASSRRRADAR